MTTISDLESAVAQIILAPVNSALASLQANPTVLNAAAQFAALQGGFIAALPALETLGIKDGAALLQQKLAAWEASLAAPVATPTPTPVPAA